MSAHCTHKFNYKTLRKTEKYCIFEIKSNIYGKKITKRYLWDHFGKKSN